MKKYTYILYVLAAGFISYQYGGCSSEDINNIIIPPELFGGYDETEAGTMMTLSALCYTAEGNLNAMQVRDSIIIQLTDTNYATHGEWKLCWGPGLSPSGANLMYVAVDTTSDTIRYAICVRGTVWSFPQNIQQDMEVWKLLLFTYGSAGDSVAYGSMLGLDTLLNTTDPITSQNLNSFLSMLNAPKQKMFITGHSLGGALATLVSAWFVNTGHTSRFKAETYTFAAPTVGNQSFVTLYNVRMLAVGAESHRVVNDRDLVPYAWAGIGSVINNRVPTNVPVSLWAVFDEIQLYLQNNGIVYKHVDTRKFIGGLAPTNCNEADSLLRYFCWVGFEHSSGTYLRLLNADTINWGR